MTKPNFYNANLLLDSPYHTDGVIYSPNVPFFRDESHAFLEKTFPVSIITAPAPCLRDLNEEDIDEEFFQATLLNRMKKIFLIAHEHDHEHLILGAWGCGAFRNDPSMVALLFKEALGWLPIFETVTFAVFDNSPEEKTLKAFQKVFN